MLYIVLRQRSLFPLKLLLPPLLSKYGRRCPKTPAPLPFFIHICIWSTCDFKTLLLRCLRPPQRLGRALTFIRSSSDCFEHTQNWSTLSPTVHNLPDYITMYHDVCWSHYNLLTIWPQIPYFRSKNMIVVRSRPSVNGVLHDKPGSSVRILCGVAAAVANTTITPNEDLTAKIWEIAGGSSGWQGGRPRGAITSPMVVVWTPWSPWSWSIF